MLFSDFDISQKLKDNLKKENITTPTDIQEKGIPHILDGKDVIGLAQTGTGKTFTFLVPIVNRLLLEDNPDRHAPIGLIIAPTRELVTQIVDEADRLSGDTHIRTVEIIGGSDYIKQRDQLEDGCDIIVATPGRLIDFLQRGKANLREIEFLVLDEADRMLDMGFANDIKSIIFKTPKERQTLMFSATMPYEIYMLAEKHMKEPVEVNVSQDSITTENIEQTIYHLGRKEKLPYLVNLILNTESDLVLIFTNMRVFVSEIVDKLLDYGIPARGISSLLPQAKRTKLMSDYKAGRIKVLVATDVASRGIDVDNITHVYNFDLPQSPENYVHRIGRTARAGSSGYSISFCSEYDYEDLGKIQKLLGYDITNADVNPDYCEFPKGEFESLRPKRQSGGRQGGGRDRDREGRGDGRRDRDRGRRREPDRDNRRRSERDGGGRGRSRDRDGERSRDRNQDRDAERSGRNRQGGGRNENRNRNSGGRRREGAGAGDNRGNRNERGNRNNKRANASNKGRGGGGSNRNSKSGKRIQHVGPGRSTEKAKKGLWGRVKGWFGSDSE